MPRPVASNVVDCVAPSGAWCVACATESLVLVLKEVKANPN